MEKMNDHDAGHDGGPKTLTIQALASMVPVFQEEPTKLLHPDVRRTLIGRLCPEFTLASVNRVIKRFTLSPDYLALEREGAPLHDLNGNVVGHLTPEMEAWAQRRLQRSENVQGRQLTVEELARRFPESFGAKPPRPLAIGTGAALHAALRPQFSKTSIDVASRVHKSRPAYLQALVVGAPRYNLAGQVAGHVAEAEAARASATLTDPVQTAPWLRLLRKGKPLDPWHRRKLLEAMERNASSPEDFAARYGVPLQGVVTQRQLASRERDLQLKAGPQQSVTNELLSTEPPSSTVPPQKAPRPTVTVRRKRFIQAG